MGAGSVDVGAVLPAGPAVGQTSWTAALVPDVVAAEVVLAPTGLTTDADRQRTWRLAPGRAAQYQYGRDSHRRPVGIDSRRHLRR